MLFLKLILDDARLLLPAIEVTPHRAHHRGAIPWATLPEGVGLDVLVEQLIGIQFGAVARQLNQSKPCRMRRDECLDEARPVHRMPVDDQIHVAPALLEQPLQEIDKQRAVERAVKDDCLWPGGGEARNESRCHP